MGETPITKTKDQIVSELQEELKAMKANIARVERPTWKTSCAYRDTPTAAVQNLQVIADRNVLVTILANLFIKEMAHNNAAEELDIEDYTFMHEGYSYDDWASDIQLRLAKINIAKEKVKLEKLLGRLEALESKELREMRELEDIMREMGK